MSWFNTKPKGWDGLSEEDQAWANNANKHWNKALEESIQLNHVPRVRFILQNKQPGRDARYHFLENAIESGAAEALKEIMADGKGFDFASSDGWSKYRAISLFAAATRPPRVAGVWQELCSQATTTKQGKVEIRSILRIALEADYPEGVKICLERLDAHEKHLFETTLISSTGKAADMLSAILSCAQRFDQLQPTLDKALLQVLRDGHLVKAQMLLRHGADPNSNDAQPLLAAAQSGNISLVEMLIRYGARIDLYGKSVLESLKSQEMLAPVAAYIEKVLLPAADPRRQAADKGFFVADEETLGARRCLPQGVTLTELFHFRKRERVLMVEKVDGAQKQFAVESKNFDALEPSAVEEARQEMVRLGGHISDDSVLRKPQVKAL